MQGRRVANALGQCCIRGYLARSDSQSLGLGHAATVSAQFRVEGGLGHSALFAEASRDGEELFKLDATEQFIVPNLNQNFP